MGRGPSDDTPEPTNPNNPPMLESNALPGEEEQGIYLLGNIADGLATGGKHISVVAPAGLAVGMVLPASPPSTSAIRIDAIDPAGYQLSYRDAADNWHPYCDATQSPDAIAMQGEWTTNGEHDPGTMITFACQESGKAAKCITWGYPPGTGGPGALMWDLHQACTQAARADYCLNGKAHTREKTPILVRDFIPGAEPPDSGATALHLVPPTYPPVPPPPDRFFFESAWAPRQKVLCLDKLRWNDFEPGTLCNGTVKDPRIDPTAAYCEDAHLDLSERNLKIGSRTMDLAQHRWSNGSGDTVTTVHGFIVDPSKPNKSVPPAGFNAPALSSEGYLLRNLTGEFATCGCVKQVFRLHNTTTGDSVVGPPGMLPGYSYDATTDFEGWLITTPARDRLAFYLYQSGTDYVTAAAWPGTGYAKVGGPSAPPIGYVIGASL